MKFFNRERSIHLYVSENVAANSGEEQRLLAVIRPEGQRLNHR